MKQRRNNATQQTRKQRHETNEKRNMYINIFNKKKIFRIAKQIFTTVITKNKLAFILVTTLMKICFANQNIVFFIKYIYIYISFLACFVALFLLYFVITQTRLNGNYKVVTIRLLYHGTCNEELHNK